MTGQAVARRIAALVAIAAVAMLSIPFVQRARADESEPPRPAAVSGCQGEHWVGAWLAAPQASSLGRADDVDGPARTFVDQTLRMIVSPRTAGDALRVRLGNRHGIAPVVVDAATVGLRRAGAALVPGSVRALTFAGESSIVIAPGAEVTSDPLFAPVRAFEDLAVSFHVAGPAVVDQHQWAQSTQYASPASSGDHAADVRGDAFTEELTGWFGVSALDVLAPRTVGTVVTLGDSITDGIGSSPDRDRRWPDVLARRFAAAGTPLSVVNAGIAGNHVVTSGLRSDAAIGPSARERVDVDVLRVFGATDLFVFEGINDIYKAEPSVDIAAHLISGYEEIIERARAAGLRVIGATITPAALTGEKEAARLAVNEWIRTSGAYDAVVDFDAVARHPGDPSRVRSEWDAHLAHLNDAGYQALAHAVPLDAFQGASC